MIPDVLRSQVESETAIKSMIEIIYIYICRIQCDYIKDLHVNFLRFLKNICLSNADLLFEFLCQNIRVVVKS